MTRNQEHVQTIHRGAAEFRGIDRGSDFLSMAPGTFRNGHNFQMNYPTLGTARTRDGVTPVLDRLVANPFKIMPGARGKLWTPPYLAPVYPNGGGSSSGFALRIGASPNKNLYVNSDHPTQTVTFYVYGGTELGISSYAWSFGDGNTESGASTSVTHGYTSAGTMTVTVSGTGTDGNTYSDSMTLLIDRRTAANPGGLPTGLPPVDETGGTPVTPEPAEPFVDVMVNGADSLTLTGTETVTVSWASRDAVEVQLNGTVVALNGSQDVEVSADTAFVARAFNAAGAGWYDIAPVTITDEPDFPADLIRLRITGADEVEDESISALTFETWGRVNPDADWELVNYTGNVVTAHAGDVSLVDTGPYSESVAFAGESGKAGSNITWDLIDTESEAVVEIQAYLENYPTVTATKQVRVVRANADIGVQFVNENGLDLTNTILYLDAGGEAYLHLSAKFTGTETVDTTFASAVTLTPSVDSAAPAAYDQPMVSFLGYAAGHVDGTAEFTTMEGGTVPADAWSAGLATVKLNVQLPALVPTYPTYLLNQTLRITAAEVLE